MSDVCINSRSLGDAIPWRKLATNGIGDASGTNRTKGGAPRGLPIGYGLAKPLIALIASEAATIIIMMSRSWKLEEIAIASNCGCGLN